MALQAAFSIRAIIYGVANTGSAPEPTAAAVFSGVTTVEAVPTAPTEMDMVIVSFTTFVGHRRRPTYVRLSTGGKGSLTWIL